jgi:hypothetical protein
MYGRCTFRGIYQPEVGLLCLSCHRSHPSEPYQNIQKLIRDYIAGLCDEPDGIQKLITRQHIGIDLGTARKQWTFNGAPLWLTGILMDRGFGPRDPAFPVQPLTGDEIIYWSEECWGCANSWMDKKAIHLQNHGPVPWIVENHIAPHPCSTCPGLQVADPVCVLCDKNL